MLFVLSYIDPHRATTPRTRITVAKYDDARALRLSSIEQSAIAKHT
eukprot:SAG31_NODE_2516_length_5580_cov_5.787448_7_plen_46_part_00